MLLGELLRSQTVTGLCLQSDEAQRILYLSQNAVFHPPLQAGICKYKSSLNSFSFQTNIPRFTMATNIPQTTMATKIKSRLPTLTTLHNLAILFCSLSLVALSTAILYLTPHALKLMDKIVPSGLSRYKWYRGPEWDADTIHWITLRYDNANEVVIIAGAAVALLAGLVGVVGFFLTRTVCHVTFTLQSYHTNLTPR